MAHHLSAIKRIGTNKKANLRNRQYRSMLRIALRKVRENTAGQDVRQNLLSAISVLDRLAGKGIIHRNTAARKKSGLYRLLAKTVQA